MTTRTYRTEQTWRPSEIDNGGHLVYIDTVHEDGTVHSVVRGTADGEHVDLKKTAKFPGPIHWENLHAARLLQGWRLVEES